ncbi:heavy-metal-associated domain-containing protein [uncultured Chitinophaga sp.]|jgi:Copper chaperone|uniref:heavy-metal-associated domain-containing protein n=1 Tax=uncultured Chitinophaga sp. TaxID=339340 RepID=UPI002613E7CE|nr:heavy-metal-associated domain-containing protein [uncultured Chitinophaga sp.]
MKTLKFKTNIKCSGCVATVTPFLNEVAGRDGWEVNLESPERTLTVTTDKAVAEGDVIAAMQKAGYKAEGV